MVCLSLERVIAANAFHLLFMNTEQKTVWFVTLMHWINILQLIPPGHHSTEEIRWPQYAEEVFAVTSAWVIKSKVYATTTVTLKSTQ